MKKIVIALILTIFSHISLIATVRVLSIGVSEYPQASGWNKLNAHNDVELIKTIFPNSISLENSKATLSGIKESISSLLNCIVVGDTILIHFSGHGQQILTSKSSVEADEVDEALVPYDAYKRKTKAYWGQHHLTDDTFGNTIDDFRRAVGPSGLVIAVIDACHSDSMDKAADDPNEIYRGTDEIFEAESFSDDKISSLREAYHKQDTTPLLTSADMSNVIYLSACKSDKRNYEVIENGKGYGSLTYYFSDAFKHVGLSDISTFLTEIYYGMANDKTLQFHGQVPAIRNTIGWEAPKKIVLPPPPPPPVPDTKPWRWYLLAVIPLIVIIALWITRKKKR